MIRNYFKVAWRTLLKNRWHSLINIIGLATSMSVCTVLFLLYQYESGFDRFRPDFDRLYRVYSDFSGVFEGVNRGVPGPAATKVKEDFSGVESATAFFTLYCDVQVPDESSSPRIFPAQQDVILADPDYFRTIGGYQWLSNNQEVAFTEPYKVVLASEKARKYFSIDNPLDAVGRTVIYQDSIQVTVAGIVDLPEERSDFYFKDFITLATAKDPLLANQIDLNEWANTNSNSQLFIKLTKGTQTSQIEPQFGPLDELYRANNPDEEWNHHYRLQPLSDLHYNSRLGIFDLSPWSTASRKALRILLLVSLLLMLIASINFINLETAKATLRAKDIGIRKTLGSSRLSLIFQYMGEAALLTLASIILAVTLADAGSKYFSDFFPAGFSLILLSWQNLIFFGLLWLIVTVLSGFYPAILISGFNATEALQSRAGNQMSSTGLRKGLIVFQFGVAQFFILATLIVGKQINFMLERDLGFNTEAIVVLNLPWKSGVPERRVFSEEVRHLPGIVESSLHQSPPSSRSFQSSLVDYENDQGEKIQTNVYRKEGDEHYIPFYGFKILAGSNFHAAENSGDVLINETYAHQLGFENAVDVLGVNLKIDDENLHVIGVVKDYHTATLDQAIDPVLMRYRNSTNTLGLKLAADDLNVTAIDRIMKQVESEWNQQFPGEEFSYSFYDEAIAKFYDSEKRTAYLLKSTTAMVVIISCLGLFGLVTFMAERRKKEISIRKVLGATVSGIVLLLSKEFIRLILLSLIIVIPLAWYFMDQWLANYTYHTTISPVLFILTGIFAMFIAFFTIGVQGLKSALIHPAEHLRSE